MPRLPIVFSPKYDIRLLGLQRLHPFDSEKYGRVMDFLQERELLGKNDYYVPEKQVSDEELLRVHTPEYLASLRKSRVVAAIAELPPLRFLPNFLLRRALLRPMRYATAGTMLGARLAMEHGWSINLSGGYHHAKADFSSGFCFFADIPLAADLLWRDNPELRVMVVDLDAHQGNGFEAIFADDPRVRMFDVYNGEIYPWDRPAAQYIHYDFPIKSGTQTTAYMALLNRELPTAIEDAKPEIIIYNAGTDIYEKDPLGGLYISAEGILARDALVFQLALERKIPILMVLSGGYTQESAMIIGSSVKNLLRKFLAP